MDTIFGVPWGDLAIGDVQRFLDDAGAEPLTWEAKADGDQRLHPASVRKAICAFANSELGGYLILGATRVNDRWSLVGLSQPPPNLSAWISSAAAGVRPSPEIDVKTWPATGGRGEVAVVWVPSVAEPPAITTDGIVYQRVSGASTPVTEPLVLANLFAKGAAARTHAEEVAKRALTSALQDLGARRKLTTVYAAFGFAATGGPDDRSSVLFTAQMTKTVEQAVSDLFGVGNLHPTRWLKRPIQAAFQQEAVVAVAEQVDNRLAELTVAWDGSVGIACALGRVAERPVIEVATGDLVRRAWSAASTILQAYRSSGRMHVAIATWDRAPEDVIAVQRWTDVRLPVDAEIASSTRASTGDG
jgi:hypothetical protein